MKKMGGNEGGRDWFASLLKKSSKDFKSFYLDQIIMRKFNTILILFCLLFNGVAATGLPIILGGASTVSVPAMHAQSCELYQIAAAKADNLLVEETKQPTILLLEKKIVDTVSEALHDAEIKAQHAFQTVKESVEETLQEAAKKVEETSHEIVEKTKTRLSLVTNLLRAHRHSIKSKESYNSLGHLSLEEGLSQPEENNNDKDKHERNKSLSRIEEVTTEKLLEITHDECVCLEPPHYHHHHSTVPAARRITTTTASSAVTVDTSKITGETRLTLV
jgi:ElaB/YqjD/DUF883 family membrane-anchored ribosome-binding protein